MVDCWFYNEIFPPLMSTYDQLACYCQILICLASNHEAYGVSTVFDRCYLFFLPAEGINDSQRWEIICKLSIGIVKGLDHLHTRSQKPIIHGNLKTNNIMLDADFQPRISDYGLYLLLNPAAAQDMLETSAVQGYKAPELIKMREVTRESDIYSLGVILLEMLAQKEAGSDSPPNARDIHLPASFKDLVLERKISDAFGSDLVRQSKNSGWEESLNAFFGLATACCNPSPSLRPDTKRILKRLEEISR
jgi:serine/threonine protein kinase